MKPRAEGFTGKPESSYSEAVNNHSNAGSIMQEMAAKDKYIAELMEIVNDLINQIK